MWVGYVCGAPALLLAWLVGERGHRSTAQTAEPAAAAAEIPLGTPLAPLTPYAPYSLCYLGATCWGRSEGGGGVFPVWSLIVSSDATLP